MLISKMWLLQAIYLVQAAAGASETAVASAAAAGFAATVDGAGADLTLAALDAELLNLELLIAAQTRKAAILGAMRRRWAAGDTEGALLASLEDEALLAALGTTGAAPARRAPRQASEPEPLALFDDQFIRRATLQLPDASGGDWADLAVLTVKLRTPAGSGRKAKAGATSSYMSLVAAAPVSAPVVLVYDAAGELLARVDVPGKAPVQYLAFDGVDADPLLAVVSTDGALHTYNMTVWRDERLVSGKRVRLPAHLLEGGEGAVGEGEGESEDDSSEDSGDEDAAPAPAAAASGAAPKHRFYKAPPPTQRTAAGVSVRVQLEASSPPSPQVAHATGNASGIDAAADRVTSLYVHNGRARSKCV